MAYVKQNFKDQTILYAESLNKMDDELLKKASVFIGSAPPSDDLVKDGDMWYSKVNGKISSLSVRKDGSWNDVPIVPSFTESQYGDVLSPSPSGLVWVENTEIPLQDGKNGTSLRQNSATAEEDSGYTLGNNATALGDNTKSPGDNAFSEGQNTTALGLNSHAEGSNTQAKAVDSHAEGSGTIAAVANQHVQGKYNVEDTEGKYTHIVGNGTEGTPANIHTLDQSGNAWFKGDVLIGGTNQDDPKVISLKKLAQGGGTSSLPLKSSPDGTAIYMNNANPRADIGSYSVAFGYDTSASGANSHAEGFSSVSQGWGSHAEGHYTQAQGLSSHSEGERTIARGDFSHAEGECTLASSLNSHVQGRFNIEDSEGKYAHIVGNGRTQNSRSNAHTLDWNGNGWFAGDVLVGGTNQDDPKTISLKKIAESSNLAVEKKFILIPKNIYTFTQVKVPISEHDTSTYYECELPEPLEAETLLKQSFWKNFETNLQDNLSQSQIDTIPNGETIIYIGDSFLFTTDFIFSLPRNVGNFCIRIIFDKEKNTKRSTLRTYSNFSTKEIFLNAIGVEYGKISKYQKTNLSYNYIDKKDFSDAVGRNNFIDDSFDTLCVGRFNNIAPGYLESLGGGNLIVGNFNSILSGYLCNSIIEGSRHLITDNNSCNNMHLEGTYNIIRQRAWNCHIEGSNNKLYNEINRHGDAQSTEIHIEGNYNQGTGNYSHIEGNYNKIFGNCNHTEGKENTAEQLGNRLDYTKGFCNHIEGYNNTLRSENPSKHIQYNHIEGQNNIIKGNSEINHVEGKTHTIQGTGNHVEGINHDLNETNQYQHYEGVGCLSDPENRYLHISGNGDKENMYSHSNAYTLDWSGNGWFAKNVYSGGIDQDDASNSNLNHIDAQITYSAMKNNNLIPQDKTTILIPKLTRWFKDTIWTAEMVHEAVTAGLITEEEYNSITQPSA